MTHTHTLGRSRLYEGSARRRDLYLTTDSRNIFQFDKYLAKSEKNTIYFE